MAPESASSYTISLDVPVVRFHLQMASVNDNSELGNFYSGLRRWNNLDKR